MRVDCDAIPPGRTVSTLHFELATAGGQKAQLNASLLVLKTDLNLLSPSLDSVLVGEFVAVVLLVVLCVGWMLWYREHQIVRVAQVKFLLAFLVGAVVNSTAILALRVNDHTSSQDVADFACNWLVVSHDNKLAKRRLAFVFLPG